jgi:signal transduction histidine kinase
VDSFDAALEVLGNVRHDIYLIDYRLGKHTGIQLLQEMRARGCNAPAILLTGQSEFEIDVEAAAAGAADFLEKRRLDEVVLERSIRYALKQAASSAELERMGAARPAELAEANARLREADRRKDEFLATLAHELRNPLAPIRNAMEVLRMQPDNPKVLASSRGRIERQVAQLVRLIDDLLDASRITRDKLSLQLEPIDLREPLLIAIETSSPLIESAGLTLEVRLPPEDVPLPVTGDRVRLTQLFTNLLNNAAKYTDHDGRVMLHAELAEGGAIRTRVRDTGVGIPAEMMAHVFELFSQINRTLNRSQGGLGIGLALVRRIAEMHAGTIEAASQGTGLGSTFTVTLPARTDSIRRPVQASTAS